MGNLHDATERPIGEFEVQARHIEQQSHCLVVFGTADLRELQRYSRSLIGYSSLVHGSPP